MACVCCEKKLVAIFPGTPLCLKDRRALIAVPTSCRVVKGGAGIWRGRWTLVPYPVNAAVICLDPLTEVIVECAGEIAVCWGSWRWCRKESRVSTVRVGSPFLVSHRAHLHPRHARGQVRMANRVEVHEVSALFTASKKHGWETTVPVLVPGAGDVVVCGGGVEVSGKGAEVVGAAACTVKQRWRGCFS